MTNAIDPFWMVWGEGKSAPKVKHPSTLLARREAERLAAKHPGERFFVLASTGCAQKIEVQFHEIDLDQIPF